MLARTASPRSMPRACRRRCARKCEDLLIDVVGLCVTARNEDYVKAALAGWDDDGPCTAIGHARTHERGRRRLRQRHRRARRGFRRHLRGRARCMPARSSCRRCSRPASGTMPTGARRCSASRSASRRSAGSASWCRRRCTRRAFIRPRCSAPWRAAAGVGAALGLEPKPDSSTRSASPARWRAASSSISPKAPGPSACIRAGRRNRACARRCSARAGFAGPRTVFEGVHGLFHGFAHTTEGDYDALTGDFGDALGDARRSPSSPIPAGP